MEGLWLEYEAGTSPEALLVKDFDKLEMILQASRRGGGVVGSGRGCGERMGLREIGRASCRERV